MNISTKEAVRLGEEAERLHYQWAEKESWKRAHVAARKAYYESMAELGYPDLEKEVPVWDRTVTFVQAQARQVKGLFAARALNVSKDEKPESSELGLSLRVDPRG